ncbi:MAG: hypothetical protein ACR2GF_00065 [Acidimicrobiales bacterium]
MQQPLGGDRGRQSILPPWAIGDRRLLAATELTRPDEVLAEAAASVATGARGRRGAMDLAEQACSWPMQL